MRCVRRQSLCREVGLGCNHGLQMLQIGGSGVGRASSRRPQRFRALRVRLRGDGGSAASRCTLVISDNTVTPVTVAGFALLQT